VWHNHPELKENVLIYYEINKKTLPKIKQCDENNQNAVIASLKRRIEELEKKNKELEKENSWIT